MKHILPITQKTGHVARADHNILGTRAFLGLLLDFVAFLSGVQSLLKGMPVAAEPPDDGHTG